MRIEMAENFDKMKQSGKARETCQTFLSLAKDPEVICDLALIKCHHRFYVAPHLKFFQQADSLCRKPGFQPFSVFSRVFLMRQDYRKMIDNFEDIERFADLKPALSRIPPDTPMRAKAEQKIYEFFSTGLEENKKLFRRWCTMSDNGLAFLAAFGEQPMGRLVAQRLLGMPLCANQQKNRFDPTSQQWLYDEGVPVGKSRCDVFVLDISIYFIA